MPADSTQDEPTEERPAIAHDDIVRRLLRYQAQLRGEITAEETPVEASPSQSAAPAQDLIDYAALEAAGSVQVEEIVDVAAAEAAGETEAVEAEESEIVEIPEFEPIEVVSLPPPDEGQDLAARVSVLEDAIKRTASSLAELRTEAQESALAIDDRLAELIAELDTLVPPSTDGESS